jgi:hypothetical protein
MVDVDSAVSSPGMGRSRVRLVDKLWTDRLIEVVGR